MYSNDALIFSNIWIQINVIVSREKSLILFMIYVLENLLHVGFNFKHQLCKFEMLYSKMYLIKTYS